MFWVKFIHFFPQGFQKQQEEMRFGNLRDVVPILIIALTQDVPPPKTPPIVVVYSFSTFKTVFQHPFGSLFAKAYTS